MYSKCIYCISRIKVYPSQYIPIYLCIEVYLYTRTTFFQSLAAATAVSQSMLHAVFAGGGKKANSTAN